MLNYMVHTAMNVTYSVSKNFIS